MKLILYPNPILDKKTEKVTQFNEELHKTLDQMVEIMLNNKGMGLSANQVGISQSFFIMKDLKGKVWDFVNPTILDQYDSQNELVESCLSVPNVVLRLPRYNNVVIEAYNRHGEVFKIGAQGIEAVCIQHEMEHLSGIMFLSHLNRQQRRTIIKGLK